MIPVSLRHQLLLLACTGTAQNAQYTVLYQYPLLMVSESWFIFVSLIGYPLSPKTAICPRGAIGSFTKWLCCYQIGSDYNQAHFMADFD
jgi:hypothetical protein